MNKVNIQNLGVNRPWLMNGDCLYRMKDIPSGSVDAIICDPPFGTIKGIGADSGIMHGLVGKTDWDECIPHQAMLNECNRILKQNGALILFCQDPYTGKLMADTHGNLPFSYRLTWVKDHFANALFAKKAPVNYTEDICVFFKKYDTLNQHPLRDYAVKLFEFIGDNKKTIFNNLGSQGICHFMRTDSTQFGLCTEKTYNQLIEFYGLADYDWILPYSELADIDDRFKRRFKRRFNLPEGEKYKSNILEYKKDYGRLHPTQKPVKLLEDLIYTYSDENDIILDFTFGSGSTGVAAKNMKRKFIGIERDDSFFNLGAERIART